MGWTKITTEKQLVDIMNLSDQQPVVLFKHSTRCPISALALTRFEAGFGSRDFFLIDVINQREISQQLAKTLNVIHESPQLLVVADQKCVKSSSHLAISAAETEETIKHLEKE